MTFQIFIANNVEALEAVNPTHTVEAEFGDSVVEGSSVTLVHHGKRAENPCPCLGDNLPTVENTTIGISHFDLDTLGGVMRCLGVKDYDGPWKENMFWKIAALVDTMGVHKLGEIRDTLWRKATTNVQMGTSAFNDTDYFFNCEWDATIESLNAFWAWSESHRLFPPRDGSAEDVTEFFTEAICIVNLLIEGEDYNKECQELYQLGKDWAAAKETLAKESLVSESHGVILRKSDQFTNHLYGDEGKVVVAFNTKFESVTISLADLICGINCCTLVQSLWGPEAGGHVGIAGSPRGQKMSFDHAKLLAELVEEMIVSSKVID